MGVEVTELLKRSLYEALRMCGTKLLDDPSFVYAMLADSVPISAPEMIALRSVFVYGKDRRPLSCAASLNTSSTATDVKVAAKRIERYLVNECILNQDVARSCAWGLVGGIASFWGIQCFEPVDELDNLRESKPIPVRMWNATVDEKVLRDGGVVVLSIIPQKVGNLGGAEVMQGESSELIRLAIPRGSNHSDVIAIPGRGYYTKDGRRGDLRVKLWELFEEEASSSGAVPKPVRGNDIHKTLTLTEGEVGSGRYQDIWYVVPSTGEPVCYSAYIPADIVDGGWVRFPEAGDYGLNGGARGDLVVTIRIVGDDWAQRVMRRLGL